MPFLSVADVLRLPVIAAGLPRVEAGEDQLDRAVRWVHVTELLDPASFLEGGELVLTTGMPQPSDPARLRGYVDQLADVGAAGLVVELGRRYQRAPAQLVAACRARDLPLIVLSRGIRFIEVTQTVHALILDAQGELLRRSQDVYEIFTALTLRRADAVELVQAAADLIGRPVILENLVHHVVICCGASRREGSLLEAWDRRSRATPTPDRAGGSGPGGWLVAPVEEQGRRWGRLIMLPDVAGPVTGPEPTMVLRRAATALTLARLTGDTAWDRQAHRSALLGLVEGRYRSQTEARIRTEALGLPTVGHRLIGVLVAYRGAVSRDASHLAALDERIAAELRNSGTRALVGRLAPGRTGVLLALARASAWQPVVEGIGRILSEELGEGGARAVVSVGPGVDGLDQVARSFGEAGQVADAIGPGTPRRAFYTPADIGLPELLYALRDDTRVQRYTEQRLGRLVEYDERHSGGMLATLRSYLGAAGNKSIAAKHAGLSRQAFYHRLHTIERLLGCDLESGAERAELHVAITALDVLAESEPER
ncbi:PucR family transcriptional regulator [Streptomyces sp. NPDC088116]|uniref:PucR family transcriptional regulator n=1 Tax=Streptomyces sp. NPDC088116 TaxID=3365825 RepID=UPI00380E56A4